MIAMPRTQPIRYQKLFHDEVQHKAKIALLTSITCKCYTAYSQACTSYYRFICAFSQFTQHKKRKCVAIASADRDSRRNVPHSSFSACGLFIYGGLPATCQNSPSPPSNIHTSTTSFQSVLVPCNTK
jgi:hypothetical protein